MRTIHTLLVLDRSGSMESVRDQTILGFNEQVQTLRELESDQPDIHHTVSLVLFNHAIVTPLHAAPLHGLRELDRNDYVPSGSTALYDAIGVGVNRIRPLIRADDRAVVTILTDGFENASREYTRRSIAALIATLEATGAWTFTFIGAGWEASTQAAAINIEISNTLTVNADPSGVAASFDRMKKGRREMAEKMKRGEDVRRGFFDD